MGRFKLAFVAESFDRHKTRSGGGASVPFPLSAIGLRTRPLLSPRLVSRQYT